VRRPGRTALGLALCLAASACTTPLERGERRYQAGDRVGALEIWRQVPPDSPYHPAVQARIAAVEDEFEQLGVRYKKRARYYESKGRLAESILNYRLALELQPGDRATLDHVQALMRELDARKRETRQALQRTFGAGDLARARQQLERLKALDPFDPDLQGDEVRLEDALGAEVERLLAEGRRDFSAGSHRGAEAAFRRVVDLDPENEAAQGYLSHIASLRDESAQLRRRHEVEPSLAGASEPQIRSEGQYQMALSAERGGDPYAAIGHDLRALRLDPGNGRARAHLAALRQRLAPEVGPLLESGRAHYQQEDLQSALDQWRRVLLIDPENAQARDYVARAELLLQNLEQLRSEPRGVAEGP
jgi:tetratricopeptide (TPR) repeat protein